MVPLLVFVAAVMYSATVIASDSQQFNDAKCEESEAKAVLGVLSARHDRAVLGLRGRCGDSAIETYSWLVLSVLAENRISNAAYAAAKTSLTSDQIEQGNTSALNWLKSTAARGEVYAQMQLADIYFQRSPIEISQPKFVEGFGWAIVAEHILSNAGPCCVDLREKIQQRIEYAATIMTSEEMSRSLEFSRKYIER